MSLYVLDQIHGMSPLTVTGCQHQKKKSKGDNYSPEKQTHISPITSSSTTQKTKPSKTLPSTPVIAPPLHSGSATASGSLLGHKHDMT